MKPLEQWLSEYSESHQNKTNILIHWICVPLIFWSIYLMLFSIPFPIPSERTMYFNMGSIVYFFVLIFWFRLNVKVGFFFLALGFMMALVTIIIWTVVFMQLDKALFRGALIQFVLAWIGQFIGHKIEGKKPSFFKDLQFLLIGPVWLVYKLRYFFSSK